MVIFGHVWSFLATAAQEKISRYKSVCVAVGPWGYPVYPVCTHLGSELAAYDPLPVRSVSVPPGTGDTSA